MSKRAKRLVVISLIFVFVLIAWHFISTAKKGPAGPMTMAPVVTVAQPIIQDVNDYYDFTGNTDAVEKVDIKARVEGFLNEVHFTDGQDVNQGQLLFTIEPNEFLAARNQAQSQLSSALAELDRTKFDYDRMEKAVQSHAVSQQDLSTAKAALVKAQALVNVANAALNNANRNLSYTKITSPITGRVSRRLVDPGNLVGAGDKTLLAIVTRMQPLYIYFNVSEETLERYFNSHTPAEFKADMPKFMIGFANQQDYPYTGVLDYVDTTVDPATGTIVIRGKIPNIDMKLFPGMYVRIRVPVGIKKDAVLIEDRALNSDLGGKFVFLVDEKNLVQKSYVTAVKKIGQLRIIDSGIAAGQRYITSSTHFVRPGAPVTPKPENSNNNPPVTQKKP